MFSVILETRFLVFDVIRNLNEVVTLVMLLAVRAMRYRSCVLSRVVTSLPGQKRV